MNLLDLSIGASDTVPQAPGPGAPARVAALGRLGDPALAALTRLAQTISGASATAIYICDERFQHRVAAAGLPLDMCAAEDSLCRHVLVERAVIVSEDATADPRFVGSPLVTGRDPVRFFASFPLILDGEPVGTLCAYDTEPRSLGAEQFGRLEDLADLARSHLELLGVAADLSRDATIDGLTGTLNRVMFDDCVARALARRRLIGDDALLTIIDVDDFKTMNDTYGHAEGDAALRFLGKRLQEATGPTAVVGRLGGDEFAVLDTSAGACGTEELLQELSRIPLGFDPPFTISLGSTYATDEDDVRSLLRRADKQMYAAKAMRVRSAGPRPR